MITPLPRNRCAGQAAPDRPEGRSFRQARCDRSRDVVQNGAVSDAQLLRLLELIRRELGAKDARAELGGDEPDDDRLVWCKLPGSWRMVAVFDEIPEDRDVLTERLKGLVHSFEGTTGNTEPPPVVVSPATRSLDDALEALAARSSAVRALVVDDSSPMLWGTSESRRSWDDVRVAERIAEALGHLEEAGVDADELLDVEPDAARSLLDERGVATEAASVLAMQVERFRELNRGATAWRHHLLAVRAVAEVRAAVERSDARPGRLMLRNDDFGYLARQFADIYYIVLVFNGTYSELGAEGAMMKALPAVESLVLAIPPVEPPPRGGRVLRMPLPLRTV